MNCKEFKIWLDNTSEEEIISKSQEHAIHLINCPECQARYEGVINAFKFMDSQRRLKLSEMHTRQIIGQLSKQRDNGNKSATTIQLISRIAAVLVISAGILTGILTGKLFYNPESEYTDSWNSEFTLLSENSDYDTFIFD